MGSLSDDFLKNENQQYILNLDTIKDITEIPQENGDILAGLWTLPVNNNIKRLINIFRIREMYSRVIKSIKILHEGFCTYYEEIIYRDLLNEIISIFRKRNINIDEELIFTPIGKFDSNQIPFRYDVENGIIVINLMDFLLNIYQIVKDPYKFGYFLINFVKKYKKEYNLFTMFDKNLKSLLSDQDDIYNFLIEIIRRTSINYKYKDKTITIPMEIWKKVIEMIKNEETFNQMVIKFFLMLFYEDWTKGKIDMTDLNNGLLKIIPTTINNDIINKLRVKNNVMVVKNVKLNEKEQKDIYPHGLKIKEINVVLDAYTGISLNYFDTLNDAIKNRISQNLSMFFPTLKVITFK